MANPPTRRKKMTASPSQLTALLFMALLSLANAQDYIWYSGKSSPYTISTEADLIGLRQLLSSNTDNFDGKIILLANDIALTSAWTPIGDGTYQFKGTFDGQGKTISDLSVDVGDYAGLFGYVGANGQIKNLNVIATEIKSSNSYAGGLVAYYASSKPIENSSVQANSITGSGYSGGLVGYAYASSTITNSYASGNVSGTSGSGSGYSGGLVGCAKTSSTITNSYASGNVSGTGGYGSYVGGLVGHVWGTLTITNSYASGNVNGNGGSSYSYVGGLVGYAYVSSTISNSYASGNVSGTGGSGSHSSYIGGLVGYVNASSTISTSYASGNITGTHSGGIFGYYASGITNTSVYYNSDGASKAAGTGSPTNILAMSSATLKKQGTYINWDFSGIWGIIENVSYPYLKTTPVKVTVPLSGDVEAEYLTGETYTGSQIKPKPTVRLKTDGTVLEKDKDYALQYSANINAGTGKITIIGIDGDYLGLQETISFDIIPKTLTLANAAAQNKVYDGTTAATITGVLEGIVAGNAVSFNGAGSFADKNAGDSKAVTANIALSGSAAQNYKLTQPENLSASITPKPLTITLSPKTVTIAQSDPMSKVTEKIVYNGLAAGDAASVISGTTAVFKDGLPLNATPAIGTHAITLSGTRTNANYAITYDNEGLQLIVTADPVNLSTCTASNIAAQTYSGLPITPAVTVTCGAITLAQGTDYTISYGSNTNAGTATAAIAGKGSYSGSIQKTFTINKKALSITGAQASDKVYDGTTAAVITGATLAGEIFGTDAVSLSGSEAGTFATANAGTGIAVSINASLTGTAANNYSIVQPSGLTASITAKPLAADAVQAIAPQTYTGSNITPSVAVTDGSKTLEQGTDYTLAFSSNRNAGTANVQAIGTGNYSGTATATFAINPKPLASSMVNAIPSQLHTGLPIIPDVIVQDGTRYLVEGTDYEVSYSGNTAAGMATVTIAGKGNYSGSAAAYFIISEPKHVEDLDIAPIPDQAYTGTAITPLPVLKDGSYELAQNIDYTVDRYTNNVSIGNAALVQVTGIGLYTGTTNIAFRIVAPSQSSSSSLQSSSSSVPSSSSIQSSSSAIPSSSSSANNPSSSSSSKPSSSSNGSTPIRLPQIANGKILAQATGNAILLQNLPQGAKIEAYNLQGKRIYFGNSGNSQTLKIQVQTKGMYIVKVGREILKVHCIKD
jgi:hypothetical protein